jgi:hypothetical protein
LKKCGLGAESVISTTVEVSKNGGVRVRRVTTVINPN